MKIFSKFSMASLFLLLCCLFACQKDDSLNDKVEEADIEVKLEDQEAHYDAMLYSLTLGVLDLAKNAEFRTLVHEEVKKQFDDDDNVLFQVLNKKHNGNLVNDLVTSIQKNRNTLIKKSRNITDSEGLFIYSSNGLIEQAVQGFEYFDQLAFSQIYIPFFELHQNNNSTPIVCIGLDDDDTTIGYRLRPGTPFWEEILVTEEIARTNLVWVVSVNESFEDSPTLIYYLENGTYPSDNPDNDPTHQLRTEHKLVSITKLFLAYKKEHWISGKANIRYQAVQHNPFCGQIPEPTVSQSNWDILKLKKSQLNTWVTLSDQGNAWPAGILNPLTPNRALSIMIYEKDRARQKNSKSWIGQDYWTCNSCTPSMTFYSKDIPYGIIDCAIDYSQVPRPSTSATIEFRTDDLTWPNAYDGGEIILGAKKGL